MNTETAQYLVRSLLGRLAHEGDAFRLPEGRLSVQEVEALRALAGLQPVAAAPPPDARIAKVSEQDETGGSQHPESEGKVVPLPTSFTQFQLNQAAFAADPPDEDDIRLCLDFGTAMSKAWATGSSNSETIPLLLGRPAGMGNTLFAPSSVFISNSGRVYFGAAAETQHRQDAGSGRKIFDNIKTLLSEAEIGQELDDVPVSKDVNPTSIPLSKGDLLVLYLGWLTDLALQELKDSVSGGTGASFGFDPASTRYTRRRFAIPCFATARDEPDFGLQRAEWARKVMRRSILRAQLVADTFQGKWQELTVRDVHAVMSQVADLNVSRLEKLLATVESVREPIAAGASRFDEHFVSALDASQGSRNQRRLVMVVDAGAGTTDFAVFQVFLDRDEDDARYALVSPSVTMSRLAGNEVDRVLKPLVLASCGITENALDERDLEIARNDLSARIRDIKRMVFTSGEAKIELRPRLRGTLNLKTIQADRAYQRLARDLKADQQAILEALFDGEALEPYRILNQRLGKPAPIFVVLTGGSSNVPIFRELAEREINIRGARFVLINVRELPQWINTLPREFSSLVSESYPQEAVAIGGSAPELPREIKDLRSAISSPREGTRVLERYQVKGVG